ncbi:MAG: DUF4373 domain-containing protein [Bacillota bacterium]|nr:DUF4373 domain-containing protein [Bacillota bacterium]
MARPQKEGMDYFPHDNDAVNDEKIEALRVLYGNDGYAFYFILLERIYRTSTFELDVSDAETIQILCKKVAVTEQQFNRMLETALKRKCFDQESYEKRKVLTSPGIKKRAAVVIEKRELMRSKYKKVSEAENPQETKSETPQSKGKERLKESKEKAYTPDESEILSFWNLKDIIKHSESLSIKKEIAKALKKLGKQKVILGITQYSNVLNDEEFYYSHKFTLANFLKQGNGIPNFLEDGQIWMNYLSRRKTHGYGWNQGISSEDGGEVKKSKYEVHNMYEEL